MKDTSPKSYAKNNSWPGRGRYWRINCDGLLQVSCKLSDWDKWSNSLCYSVPHIPTTEKEFSDTVEFMLKRCKRKERLMDYLMRMKGQSMNKYWEEQVKRLKEFSTPSLRKNIDRVECLLQDFPETSKYGFLEYLQHLKCEYAERIGK